MDGTWNAKTAAQRQARVGELHIPEEKRFWPAIRYLNAEDGKLEVYRRHERVAARREELVEAIRSN